VRISVRTNGPGTLAGNPACNANASMGDIGAYGVFHVCVVVISVGDFSLEMA
jgi:hypothetical protein